MKIAIIQPRSPYHIAGSEKVSLKQAEHLARLGNQVQYYTAKIPNGMGSSFLFDEFVKKDIPNLEIKYFDITKVLPNLYQISPDNEHTRWTSEALAFNQVILSELEGNRPDVIFSYYLPDSIFKPSGIPNVVYLSGYPKERIPMYSSFLEFVTSTVSISNQVANKWEKDTKGKSREYVLPTGVEIPETVDSKVTKKAGVDLVFAGRLIERKGIHTLINAIKKLKNFDKVHLWILGDGELKEFLKDTIERLGLKEKVTMTGNVQNPYDYFSMSDICVFPSHYGDGLMGTVLESMACGKPVIATTGNGNEDVIKTNINGILVPQRDDEALIKAIDRLCDNKEERDRLGENAKITIENNFTWEIHSKRLSGMLSEIIQENNEARKELKFIR